MGLKRVRFLICKLELNIIDLNKWSNIYKFPAPLMIHSRCLINITSHLPSPTCLISLRAPALFTLSVSYASHTPPPLQIPPVLPSLF